MGKFVKNCRNSQSVPCFRYHSQFKKRESFNDSQTLWESTLRVFDRIAFFGDGNTVVLQVNESNHIVCWTDWTHPINDTKWKLRFFTNMLRKCFPSPFSIDFIRTKCMQSVDMWCIKPMWYCNIIELILNAMRSAQVPTKNQNTISLYWWTIRTYINNYTLTPTPHWLTMSSYIHPSEILLAFNLNAIFSLYPTVTCETVHTTAE